ncbi:hypothetical protein SESBI_04158 [Sesbania bispinosa]|nr:hypothetical protein SESBI_04158 [Sesbania bispinosa]
MKRLKKVMGGQSSGVNLVQVDPEVFKAPDVQGKDTIDEDYVSDELHSDLDEGYGSENNDKPKYPTFQKEEMCRDYKFRLGMEFRSLKECKVKCKRDCQFTAFVSKVGRTSTYRMKTLVGRHTCGRIFNNKNASSQWVAKVMVDKLKSNNNLTLKDRVEGIRMNYSAGISIDRAFKARKIARGVVEGDAINQYSLLWRYSAELNRESRGNTCKIELDRPSLERNDKGKQTMESNSIDQQPPPKNQVK